jgi:NADH dehydrogenase
MPAAEAAPVKVDPARSGPDGPGHGRIVAVLGGTGFLGRRVVRHLLGHGFRVRAASRRVERARSLFELGEAGVEALGVDVHDEATVAAALAGAYGAVNAVSLYVERGGRETFRAIHVEAAARVARLAREAGVARLVHVSGIGADPASPSAYIRARGDGEAAVRAAFPGATLVRPSAMFGTEDSFLATLVWLLRTLPAQPLFGRGRTRLQPVHVEDVAEAIARILADAAGAGHPCYEFGGPRVYAYADLLRSIASRIGARARLVPVPFAAWDVLARLSGVVPGIPLTRDQVALMRRDNVASGDLPGLRDLRIVPATIEEVLPADTDRSGAAPAGR